jgi:hypothetical protein
VKARIAVHDIGKVKLGQAVIMRVSAYAYPDYGTLKGKVTAMLKFLQQTLFATASPHNLPMSSPILTHLTSDAQLILFFIFSNWN